MTWNTVPAKMEQNRRIKSTVQRLFETLSFDDKMGCSGRKMPFKRKEWAWQRWVNGDAAHVNGFQRATMGTLVHLLVIYLYHANGCRMATTRTTAA